jgi:hypothetical protein
MNIKITNKIGKSKMMKQGVCIFEGVMTIWSCPFLIGDNLHFFGTSEIICIFESDETLFSYFNVDYL